MMGRQERQMGMLIMDMEELIPYNHLLRRINSILLFEFVYDIYWPHNIPSMDGLLLTQSACSRCC